MTLLGRFLSTLVYLITYVVYCMPLFTQQFFGICIGLLWFDILRVRRQTAIENVLKVFPDLSKREATKMARTSLIHMGYTIIEFCSIPHYSRDQVSRLVRINNAEILDKAFEQGKGVLLIPPHVGNGDIGTAALSHHGYKTHLVSKVFKSQWLNTYWFEARKKHGTQFIPPRRSSYEILKTLKKNEMVIFVLDQYTGPPNGILTTFFGLETGTALGPALFAQRSGAVVVPAYAYREKFGQHVVEVLPPVSYETEGDTKEELIRKNTESFNRAVESMILKKPEQWMWVHRRWKKGW